MTGKETVAGVNVHINQWKALYDRIHRLVGSVQLHRSRKVNVLIDANAFDRTAAGKEEE